MARTTQSNWRCCTKCGGLFFTGQYGKVSIEQLKCKGGGKHDFAGTTNRKLTKVDPPAYPEQSETEEAYWRFCVNCRGLFHVLGDADMVFKGICGQTGGDHEYDQTHANYVLKYKVGSPTRDESAVAYFECVQCGSLYHPWNDTAATCNNGGRHTRAQTQFELEPRDKYYILQKA